MCKSTPRIWSFMKFVVFTTGAVINFRFLKDSRLVEYMYIQNSLFSHLFSRSFVCSCVFEIEAL